MLAPQVDFLFDRGFISFGDGKLLVSEVVHVPTLVKLGIDPERPPEVGDFDKQQEGFLDFHRSDFYTFVRRPKVAGLACRRSSIGRAAVL